MEITIEELKIQPDEIISRVYQGYDITIISNGKAYAKIIPVNDKGAELDNSKNELFGLWKDRDELDDVEFYVRRMRQGRKL
jgi:prevent-host-death family protein